MIYSYEREEWIDRCKINSKETYKKDKMKKR